MRLPQKETCAAGMLVTSAAPSNRFTDTLSTSWWTPVHTLDAVERKLSFETAACFDSVKSMQAWPSDVVSVCNQRNEALLHELEDASAEIPDLEDTRLAQLCMGLQHDRQSRTHENSSSSSAGSCAL